MSAFDRFRSDLQSALTHLHSADCQFSARVCQVLGCEDESAGAVQSTFIRWIESLKPPPDTPEEARTRQLYLVLRHRYVLGLTQEETAHTLYMSPRTLQRNQRNAVHLLARRIWDAHEARAAAATRGNGRQYGAPATWEKQVKQELRSLQQSTVSDSCDLQAAVQGALRIATESIHRAGVALNIEGVPENCQVRLHRSVAEQVVLMVLAALEQVVGVGEIALEVSAGISHADVVFRASPVTAETAVDLAFARELVEAQGGSLAPSREGHVLVVTLRLSRAPRASARYRVLVVDDNVNLVALYSSYCIDTNYEVFHVGQGNRLVEVAAEIHPHVILLDVLLPDVNGWQLLMDLRTTPATCGIPVIVCSVIADAQMALKLGGSLYLQKPVWRQQFLDALNQVVTVPLSSP